MLWLLSVVKRRGMVDDPSNDFNRVTSSIKEDITSLNAKLGDLEVLLGVMIPVCPHATTRQALMHACAREHMLIGAHVQPHLCSASAPHSDRASVAVVDAVDLAATSARSSTANHCTLHCSRLFTENTADVDNESIQERTAGVYHRCRLPSHGCVFDVSIMPSPRMPFFATSYISRPIHLLLLLLLDPLGDDSNQQ